MLTSLTIVDKAQSIWYKKIVNFIRGDKTEVQVKSSCGVVLRSIIYTNRKNNINWRKIENTVGIHKNCLIFNPDIKIPENINITRYINYDFEKKISINLVEYVLKNVKDSTKLKIGIYDLCGKYTSALKRIINYSSKINVVTENLFCYEQTAEEVMEEYGASFMISEDIHSLSDCNIIIAPDKIETNFPIKHSTFVFTVFPPAVCLNGVVYYKYIFNMPQRYKSIKPDGLDEMYFTSVLYSKGRQQKLDKIIPCMCMNNLSLQTVKSLITNINNVNFCA